ncbi:hypothetical protein [Kineococcus sp. G2]|uniref:hypothetical protein n=1 Tax=Kineococcus sp. G2 TaxID=3127484 RepID=UPI00301BF688
MVGVAAAAVIAHAGDLRPRQVRLAGEHLAGDGSDGLADLGEVHPDGWGNLPLAGDEDEAVGQLAAAGVGVDGVEGRLHVQQALAQSGMRESRAATRVLQEHLGGVDDGAPSAQRIVDTRSSRKHIEIATTAGSLTA